MKKEHNTLLFIQKFKNDKVKAIKNSLSSLERAKKDIFKKEHLDILEGQINKKKDELIKAKQEAEKYNERVRFLFRTGRIKEKEYKLWLGLNSK